MTQQNVPYIPALTGLRGYAVIGVLLYHLIALPAQYLHFGYDVGIGRYADWGIIDRIFSFGWYGVDIFFVLSGFVISYVYCDYLNHHLFSKRTLIYLLLRFLRLYPAYLASLLILIMLAAMGMWDSSLANPSALPYHYTLTYAWWFYPADYGQTWNLPTWSLSAEFFSYYLFPLLLIAISKLKKINLCIILVCFLCITIQIINSPILGTGALMRATMNFLLGCLAYRVYMLQPYNKHGAVMVLAGIILLILSTAIADWIVLFLSSFCIFGIVLGLAYTNRAHVGGALVHTLFANRAILYVGDISYAIYVIQFPCMIFLGWLISHYFQPIATESQTDGMLLIAMIGFIISFIGIAATLLHRFIEKPIQRFFKGRIQRM